MTKPWLVKKDSKETFVEVMGAKVYLKPLKYGKSREAMSIAVKVNPMTGKADMDTGLLATLRALYQIKDWELTNENDEKLPITLETLDNELSEEFVEKLIQAINLKTQGKNEVTEEEKK
jgi:hypothetical protein